MDKEPSWLISCSTSSFSKPLVVACNHETSHDAECEKYSGVTNVIKLSVNEMKMYFLGRLAFQIFALLSHLRVLFFYFTIVMVKTPFFVIQFMYQFDLFKLRLCNKI